MLAPAPAVLRSARCRASLATSVVRHHRLLSSDSHAHHDEHHDDGQYPKEELSPTFWRNTILLSLVAVGFYKFAPAPGEDAAITRWLAKNTTPREVWEYRNGKHLSLAQQASSETLLIADARRPPVHRYRYPQSFEQKSPHMVPVGGDVDLTALVVKNE